MSDFGNLGTRLRNRRLDLGLKQAQVAEALSISGSYLNLIEHNKRRIAEPLLTQMAQLLEMDMSILRGGGAQAQTHALKAAASALPQSGAEQAKTEDFAARYPGWAGLIEAQAERIKALEARVQALGDRLVHDTQIATSLHEVISTATAIRSTASILVETPDLDRDWQGRFHGNIDTDAARLAESSQALLGFLDIDDEVAAGNAPLDAAEAAMAEWEHFVPEAERQGLPDLSEFDPVAAQILSGWITRAGHDAERLPLAEFEQAARALAYDPARLAARFHVPLEMVLRRLAHLPREGGREDHPAMGLAECDAAGVVIYQKPVLDFRLPRAGATCPLWPMYQALTQPGRPVRRLVKMAGVARTAFECTAIAAPVGAIEFERAPRITATMLVRPVTTPDVQADPVGPGCRICTILDCDSRRHPSIV